MTLKTEKKDYPQMTQILEAMISSAASAVNDH